MISKITSCGIHAGFQDQEFNLMNNIDETTHTLTHYKFVDSFLITLISEVIRLVKKIVSIISYKRSSLFEQVDSTIELSKNFVPIFP